MTWEGRDRCSDLASFLMRSCSLSGTSDNVILFLWGVAMGEVKTIAEDSSICFIAYFRKKVDSANYECLNWGMRKSDTPETDAELAKGEYIGWTIDGRFIKYARNIERELMASRAANIQMRSALERCAADRGERDKVLIHASHALNSTAAPEVVPLAVHQKVVEALAQSLRQWKSYADAHEGENLDEADHMEGKFYRAASAALSEARKGMLV